MTYRPEGFVNPHVKVRVWAASYFEAGADAMLEALKHTGARLTGDTVMPAFGEYPEIHVPDRTKGWVVLIPDDEEVKP